MRRVLDGAEPLLTRKQLPNNATAAILDLDALRAASSSSSSSSAAATAAAAAAAATAALSAAASAAGPHAVRAAGAGASFGEVGAKPLNVNAPNFTLPASSAASPGANGPGAMTAAPRLLAPVGPQDAGPQLPADLGDEEFHPSALPDLSSPSPATTGIRILALAVYRPTSSAGNSTMTPNHSPVPDFTSLFGAPDLPCLQTTWWRSA